MNIHKIQVSGKRRFFSRNVMLSADLYRACVYASVMFLVLSNVSLGQDAAEPALRLQYRAADQSILYVIGEGHKEVKPAQQAGIEMNVEIDSIPSLLTLPLDCSNLHAIILGSNAVDFLGGKRKAERKSQVFATLEEFVAEGGHLFVFGSYNGRNSERLTKFGIHTTPNHNDYFRAVPGRTEVLFSGSEKLIPTPALAHSQANFSVDQDRLSVVMLQRGVAVAPVKPKNQSFPDGPVIATVAYKRGRVTYCAVEPMVKALWLVPVAVKWIARGAPTNHEQLEENVVVPRSLLRTRNDRQILAFDPSVFAAAQDWLDQEFGSELSGLTTPADKLRFADVLMTREKQEKQYARRFALTRSAWQLAADGGDFGAADAILSEAATVYTFDQSEARLQLVPTIEKATVSTSAGETTERLIEWSDNARSLHQYAHVKKFLLLAQQLITDSPNAALTQAVAGRLAGLDSLVAARELVATDLEHEETIDADGAVKTRLGRFFALSVRDFERGIPLLADGSNAILQECAKLDLEQPVETDQQVQLADQWLTATEGLTPLELQGVQQRARHWYLIALPSLAGVNRNEVTAKIAKLESPRTELRFQMQVDGAGRLEISRNGIQWTDHFGTPVAEIKVGPHSWTTDDMPVFLNSGRTKSLPDNASLDFPRLRKTAGRGMVTLERNSLGLVIVNINDVPSGNDNYDFSVELIR